MDYTFTVPVPREALLIGVAIPLAVVVALLLLMLLPMITVRVELSERSLEIRALPLYRIVVKREDVVEVRVVDLRLEQELRPALRTFGHSLPHLKLGWFKLKGGQKAFLAVSSDTAVAFRLRDGSYVVATPTDLEGFMAALRALRWL